MRNLSKLQCIFKNNFDFMDFEPIHNSPARNMNFFAEKF